MRILLGACIGITIASLTFALTPDQKPQQPPDRAALGQRVTAACKPMQVSNWNIDYTDPSIINVTCYNPKTGETTTTAVER